MTKHPEKLKEDFVGTDPAKPFYLALSVWNADGSLSLDSQPCEGAADNPDDLAEIARELAEEHGQECYIYHCVPVRRVTRGKVRTVELKVKK